MSTSRGELAKRIDFYLKKKDWPQYRLAYELGYSPSYLSKLKNGEAPWPSQEVFEKMCKLLDIEQEETQELLALAGFISNVTDDNTPQSTSAPLLDLEDLASQEAAYREKVKARFDENDSYYFSGDQLQRDLRNRQIMLQRVHNFWVKGVLENSLYNEVLIELGIETQPDAVEYPWNMIIQHPDQPNHQLPHDTRVVDIFDESAGSLLILGEPGSGKTTVLLDLARQLIVRAQDDLIQSIPVVFNLSSWAAPRLPLKEWLVNELRGRYRIPNRIAQNWIQNEKLTLLLDGLDEVHQVHRDSCVEAINIFRDQSFFSFR